MEEAINYVIEEGYSRYPVYKESMDHINGFVLTKDLLATLHHKQPTVLPDLVRDVLFISSSKKISQVLRMFQQHKNQMAIVVNEFGGTVGLLTLEDIIEELVGDIQDEYDTEPPIVEAIEENKFRIHAQHAIDEINEFLPKPFPESETYITLAGLILEKSENIPEEGQEIEILPYRVKVIQITQNSPEVLEVELISVEENNDEE
jgi:CBS domain containing-hemolysin-like protein